MSQPQFNLDEFEVMTATGRSYHPRATISASGYIGFNEGAVERYQIRTYQGVVLMVHPSRDFLAIRLTNDSTQEGYRKLRVRDKGVDLAARTVLDKYNVRPDATSYYEILETGLAEALVLDLTSGRKRGKNGETFFTEDDGA